MDTRQAYNHWALQYDRNSNKTRDLEAIALRTCLADIHVENCLEIGCGTGKNTSWLIERSKHITAVDLSEEMLSRAKEKITAANVEFIQADILLDWSFTHRTYQLVIFSLVLEHIQHLEPVFSKVGKILDPGGYVYLGELHPYKQYQGSKARFETEAGTQVVECFNHHISDFTAAAKKSGLQLVDLNEYFDTENPETVPRILTLLFEKVK